MPAMHAFANHPRRALASAIALSLLLCGTAAAAPDGPNARPATTADDIAQRGFDQAMAFLGWLPFMRLSLDTCLSPSQAQPLRLQLQAHEDQLRREALARNVSDFESQLARATLVAQAEMDTIKKAKPAELADLCNDLRAQMRTPASP